jgi:hypothetical protein
MTLFSLKSDVSSRKLWPLMLAGALLTGCRKDDVQVYKVAKEDPNAANAQAGGPSDASPGEIKPTWTLPSGWEEVPPGPMRVASFKVAGTDGKAADVSIIPLPGMAGSDLDNVNRWRNQVGQPPVTPDDLAKISDAITIAGQPGQLFDQNGTGANGGGATRILASILRREGTAWFFKMAGDDALVSAQKASFVQFLKSINFPAAAAPAGMPAGHPPVAGGGVTAPAAPAEPAGQDKPVWQVPTGWQEVAAGQFLVAKFQLAGSGNAQAAVNVSMSGGDGGGLLMNLNRWRQQLGLAPAQPAEMSGLVKPLASAGEKAVMVEMSGTDARTSQKARLVAVVVPREQQTWFYKLMGDEQIVQRELSAFTNFTSNVKYP